MFPTYLSLLLLPSLSAAYTFTFTSPPIQCQNLSLTITGTGQPPYSVLTIPFGPTPFSNNTEVRRIQQHNITGSDTSSSFLLPYPEHSQFVVVVSDATGFGSGGTSVVGNVQGSSNSACYDPSVNVQPDFVFSVFPSGGLTQCSQSRIGWDNSTVQGIPVFQGIIPGGQSFIVPQGPITTVVAQGTGFSWTPSVRGGTTLLITGGDNRGLGTAGSFESIINQGDNSCLNNNSPSSTPGSPAGGSFPTGPTTGGSPAGSHVNVGAIVGGVIAGIVGLIALLLILLFFRRREAFHKSQKESPVDLLQDNEHDQDQDAQLPQYYRPDPFVLPDPTAPSTVNGSERNRPGSSAGLRPSTDHRLSQYSDQDMLRAATPEQSATSASTYFRKSPAPPTFRPVNIIQHDDAGPSEDTGPDTETIELPPAYTNIKRRTSPPPTEISVAETSTASEGAD